MSSILFENVILDVVDLEARIVSLRERIIHKKKGNIVNLNKIRLINNMSFSFKDGDKVGIIGRNGSGKSTILRLISGIYPQETGKIIVKGKINSMIDQGVGFDPMISGRKNIKLGFIYNNNFDEFSKEIEEKIIEFVEFKKDIIEKPFYTYSLGMRARLLFATSFFQGGDILLMDEVFATGDEYFIKKAYKQMQIKWHSVDIGVFVSHNLEEIREVCNKCLVIKDGKIFFQGEVEDAIEYYHKIYEDK